MRYVRIAVYELDELEDNVRSRVIASWRDDQEFYWGDDWRATLDAFVERFGAIATIKDWRIEPYARSWISAEYADACEYYDWYEELTGVRLWKWLQAALGVTHTQAIGHCELTGVYCDDDIMEPLYRFIARPDRHASLESLLETCFRSWVCGYHADFEYWLSEDAVREEIIERGVVFFEDGRVYSSDPLPPVWHVACRRYIRNRYHILIHRIRRWRQYIPV